jgi:hypothetical protein
MGGGAAANLHRHPQIYTVTRSTWAIVSGTQNYTVGSGGDVNIAWPVYLEYVNYQDTAPTDTTEYQLSPLTEQAWSRVPIKTLESPQPTAYYYNPTYPLGTLSFWPVTTSSTLQGVIGAPTAVAAFASLSTAVALPPGYRRMLIKNLAMDMASAFEREPSPGLVMDARESKAVVKRSNKRLMDMDIEVAALGQAAGGRHAYNITQGP